MDELAFKNIIETIEKKNLKAESLIITEREREYRHFFVPEKLTDIRSIAKTITTLCLGIAITKGYFKDGIETFVLPYFKDIEITNEANSKYLELIQIKHLLTHTMGHDKQLLDKSHLKALSDDINLVKYVLNYPLKHAPGEYFCYSNAPIYLLSVIIEKVTGMKLQEFAKQEIMDKMNINFNWSESKEHHTWGATGLETLPTDLHKLGKLFLDSGKYNELQIVPNSWLEEMRTFRVLTPTWYIESTPLPKYGYGYNLWICENGIYYKDGTDAQYMIINPNKNILITITANDQENRHKILKCLKEIL